MKNSILCILLFSTISCTVNKNADQPSTPTENIPATPLSSLLGNFKNATLPYPNSVDTLKFKKFTKSDDGFLREILSSCNLITIDDLSSESVWAFGDLGQDSTSMKYLAEDTSTCIVPGFMLFQDENFVVVSVRAGAEQQGVDTNYLLGDHELLCVITREGKCVNAITVGYYLGNIHGYVNRTFSFDQNPTFHIYEKGGITSDTSQYSTQLDYQILPDGRIELK